MQKKKSAYFTKSFFSPTGMLGVLFLILAGGCTTIDYEAPDANHDVYRLKIENTSDRTISYYPEVSVYYIDGKVNAEVSDSTIEPDEGQRVILESKEGTFGISVDVRVRPPGTTLKLILEKGTGTGENFELDEVVETAERNFIVTIRYGEVY